MRPTPEQSCTLWLIASWEDTFADSQWDSGEPVHHLQPNHYARAPAAPNGSGGQPSPYVLVGDSGSTSYDSTTNSGLTRHAGCLALTLPGCAALLPLAIWFITSRTNITVGAARKSVRVGRAEEISACRNRAANQPA